MYQGSVRPTPSPNPVETAPAAPATKLKNLALFLGTAAATVGIAWLLGALFSVSWALWIGVALAAVIVLIGIPDVLKARQGPCPFCKTHLPDLGHDIGCPTCFELLVLEGSTLRARTARDEDGTLWAPLLKEANWPADCLTCGAPASRKDDLRTAKLNIGAALQGSLGASFARAGGVPYCESHKEQVSLQIDGDEAKLIFADLETHRRFVSLNRGGKPV